MQEPLTVPVRGSFLWHNWDMRILGLDLSGPTNTADTCLTAFEERDGRLAFLEALTDAGDLQVLQAVQRLAGEGELALGLDAPLSYQPGGGDRSADRELRARLQELGGGAGVMTPTMTRMAYLTLRGVTLTRLLAGRRLVEVHPGAVLLLRGAARADVAGFKRDPQARLRLLDWMEARGLDNLPRQAWPSDHFVAACAAALGAWDWALGKPAWIHPAEPPLHPYDFAC